MALEVAVALGANEKRRVGGQREPSFGANNPGLPTLVRVPRLLEVAGAESSRRLGTSCDVSREGEPLEAKASVDLPLSDKRLATEPTAEGSASELLGQ